MLNEQIRVAFATWAGQRGLRVVHDRLYLTCPTCVGLFQKSMLSHTSYRVELVSKTGIVYPFGPAYSPGIRFLEALKDACDQSFVS